MKRILYIILSVALICFVGCSNDNEAGYMGDADARLSKVITSYETTLTTAPNGWLMVVSTGSGGAMRYWMSFDNHYRVNMYTDFFEANGYTTSDQVQQSGYRIRPIQRPTLCFDTYTYIHVPADPNGGLNGGNDGEGLLADFEFEIISYTNGKFLLEGRQNKCEAYMVMATAEQKAAVEAGQLMSIQEEGATVLGQLALPEVVIADRSIVFTSYAARNITLSYMNDKGGIENFSADCYVEFDKNIILLKPIALLGVQIDKLLYKADSDSYVMLDSKGAEIPIRKAEITTDLTTVLPYEGLNEILITLDSPGVSDYFIELFKDARSSLLSSTGGDYELYAVDIQLVVLESDPSVPRAAITYYFIAGGKLNYFGSTYYPLLKNKDGSYKMGRLPGEYITDYDPSIENLLNSFYRPLTEGYFGKFSFNINAIESIDDESPSIEMIPVGFPNYGVTGICM